MTFEEWVAVYEKKSGDAHKVPQGSFTLWDERRGYAQFLLSEDKKLLITEETCGDGKFWYEWAINFCREHDIPKFCTTCTRKILPYLRGMGGKIIKQEIQTERHNGYKIEGVTHEGLRFFCWPRWWDEEKQRNAYYVVVEVTK